MGRHSSPSQVPFYRSVAGWFLPWVLLGIVVGIVVWAGIGMVGGDDIDPVEVTADSSPSPEKSDEPSPEESPAPEEVAEASPKPKDEDKDEDKGETKVKPKLITKDITVQVLNATAQRTDAEEVMADKLAGLGYEVIAVGGANRVYQETTVFWSFNESRSAAEVLAERFGWRVEPKPSNLSTDVDLHVVVGEDFQE